jgi:alkylhydroperoxidase family enzyme
MSTEDVDIRDETKWQWAAALRPRSAADTDGDVSRVLEKLESTAQDQMILRLVANSPNAFRPFVLMANALVNQATLPADVREAVVLHLAVELCDAYEWHSHTAEAAKAGLSRPQIDAIGAGRATSDATGLSDGQRLAIDLVDRLRGTDGWSDTDWEAAIGAWGREGAMDLVLSTAWWAGYVPIVLRALRLVPAT